LPFAHPEKRQLKRSPRTWIIYLKCIVIVIAENIDKGPYQMPITLVRRGLELKFYIDKAPISNLSVIFFCCSVISSNHRL
jgi:hypothetical protein